MRWADPAQDRHFCLGEARRNAVPEIANAVAGVPRGKAVEMLTRSRLGHLDHGPPDLQEPQRSARVVTEDRHPRIAPHVPLLLKATHRVDKDIPAIEVAPDHRRLRIPVRHHGRERGDTRAVDEVQVRRGDLSAHGDVSRRARFDHRAERLRVRRGSPPGVLVGARVRFRRPRPRSPASF